MSFIATMKEQVSKTENSQLVLQVISFPVTYRNFIDACHNGEIYEHPNHLTTLNELRVGHINRSISTNCLLNDLNVHLTNNAHTYGVIGVSGGTSVFISFDVFEQYVSNVSAATANTIKEQEFVKLAVNLADLNKSKQLYNGHNEKHLFTFNTTLLKAASFNKL